MEHLGLSVNRLIRVSFGPFMLGDIEPGQIEEVKTSVLKDQLGPRLARQLGVKRQPVREERRLPPARSKPTYLRRKQDAVEKPERLREERPMRRRRILAEGGEAAKVELVPDKKRRPARFDRGGEGGPEQRALRRHGEKPEGEDREHRSGRDDSKYTRGEARPGDNRAERREDRHSQSAGDGPRWKSSSDRSSEDRRREQREERPRWKTSPERGTGRATAFPPGWRRTAPEGRLGTRRRRLPDERCPNGQRRAEDGRSSNGDRPKPFEKRFQRRRDARERPRWKSNAARSGGEGPASRARSVRGGKSPRSTGQDEARALSAGDGDEQRPKAASEPRREGSQRDERRPYGQRRAEEGRSNGDRPKPFEKRFQRREDGREENRGARHGREAETHAVKGEAESRRMQRPEGRSQRPQRRAEGASEGGKPRFSRSGARTVRSASRVHVGRAASPSSPAPVRRKGHVRRPA